jgi:hypothetical protein
VRAIETTRIGQALSDMKGKNKTALSMSHAKAVFCFLRAWLSNTRGAERDFRRKVQTERSIFIIGYYLRSHRRDLLPWRLIHLSYVHQLFLTHRVQDFNPSTRTAGRPKRLEPEQGTPKTVHCSGGIVKLRNNSM